MSIGELAPPFVYCAVLWARRAIPYPGPLPPKAGRKSGPEVIRAEELALPLTAVFGRADSALHFGSTVERTLNVGIVGKSALRV